MAEIKRTADVTWEGDIRAGKGQLSVPSGALENEVYTWSGRFENAPTTNPEELVAAAHAGCFSMNLAGVLKKKGYEAQRIQTHAVLTMEQVDGAWTITRVRLEVEGQVANLDQAAFEQIADEAERTCPISRLLRPGLEVVAVVAKLA